MSDLLFAGFNGLHTLAGLLMIVGLAFIAMGADITRHEHGSL